VAGLGKAGPDPRNRNVVSDFSSYTARAFSDPGYVIPDRSEREVTGAIAVTVLHAVVICSKFDDYRLKAFYLERRVRQIPTGSMQTLPSGRKDGGWASRESWREISASPSAVFDVVWR